MFLSFFMKSYSVLGHINIKALCRFIHFKKEKFSLQNLCDIQTNFHDNSGTIHKFKIVYLIFLESFRCIVSNKKTGSLLDFYKGGCNLFSTGCILYTKNLVIGKTYIQTNSRRSLELSISKKNHVSYMLGNFYICSFQRIIESILEFYKRSNDVFAIGCSVYKNMFGGPKKYFFDQVHREV